MKEKAKEVHEEDSKMLLPISVSNTNPSTSTHRNLWSTTLQDSVAVSTHNILSPNKSNPTTESTNN